MTRNQEVPGSNPGLVVLAMIHQLAGFGCCCQGREFRPAYGYGVGWGTVPVVVCNPE